MTFRKTKMRSRTIAIAIVTLLIISMGTSVVLIPSASAHTPSWQIPTTAYVAAEPNPVGVNQQILIYFWINLIFGGQSISTNGAAQLTNNYRFHDYNLTIVSPNGTVTTTIVNIVTDPTSSAYTRFTPTEVGTYTLIFTFPGQNYTKYDYDPTSPFVGDTYLPSTKTSTLTVQQEPLSQPQGSSPLPTEYWTRPIYGENTDWWSISSNWLGTGSPVSSATGSGYISAFSLAPGFGWGSDIERYPGDAVGPLTGHIMWTYPLQDGGVVGGNNVFGDIGATDKGITWFEGSAYEQRYVNPIILNGNNILHRTSIIYRHRRWTNCLPRPKNRQNYLENHTNTMRYHSPTPITFGTPTNMEFIHQFCSQTTLPALLTHTQAIHCST